MWQQSEEAFVQIQRCTPHWICYQWEYLLLHLCHTSSQSAMVRAICFQWWLSHWGLFEKEGSIGLGRLSLCSVSCTDNLSPFLHESEKKKKKSAKNNFDVSVQRRALSVNDVHHSQSSTRCTNIKFVFAVFFLDSRGRLCLREGTARSLSA